MFIKKKVIPFLLLSLIILAFSFSTIVFVFNKYDSTPVWVKDNKLVAHALGEIDGKVSTNSMEAFINSYNKGFRVFETDLILTSDGFLVARHDWNQYLGLTYQNMAPYESDSTPLSLKEFKSYKIYGKFAPLTFEDIAVLMHKYKDIYLVTDTKATDKESILKAFSAIHDTSVKVDKSILDRIIPQIYNQNMLDTIKVTYNYKDIIYTLYQSGQSDSEVLDYAIKNNISVVTMSTNRCDKEFSAQLNKYGIYVYTHTVDDAEFAASFSEKGVYGFYTNNLSDITS